MSPWNLKTVRRIAPLATAALVGLAVPPVPGQPPAREAEGLTASFRSAARGVLPAVVTVRPEGVIEGPALDLGPGARLDGPGFRRPRGGLVFPPVAVEVSSPGGSGVVIDAAKGLVLTNDHVIDGASRVVIVLADGRERPASKVVRDPRSDLALVTIDPKDLTAAPWGDSDALDIGDWVLAVGQPFGLSGTVTAGIVSGKSRGAGMAPYEDLIQTDAAINPGNSGGPLVNLKGEVVGINTALKSVRGGFEGVGFAVPASRAKRVAADLNTLGRVRRSYLGVTTGPVSPEVAETLRQGGAVAIRGVGAGSPAEKAGLRPGEAIVGLQGEPLRGLAALQAAIEFATPGEPLALVVIGSDGNRREVQVRPELAPDGAGPVAATGPTEVVASRPATEDFPPLGLRLAEAERDRTVPDSARGLTVLGVTHDGPADRGGLERGMVITDAADRRVTTIADFREALVSRTAGRDLLLRVLRGGKAEFRVILDRDLGPPGDAPPPGR